MYLRKTENKPDSTKKWTHSNGEPVESHKYT